ncbi:hypothetical protein CALCODRAFT_492826 [Calocera cornea HHB12733]|uniref:Uncharacterized protein n=1 Tax=Calocera cornea HHB12733 TaxID=1353952 RepID=A0A165I7X5_9BASI|nr:hypothetical protein CALCODRAFT_492826 [Calocera cornea HHB12733]
MSDATLPPLGKFPAQGKAVVIPNGTQYIVGDSRDLPLAESAKEQVCLPTMCPSCR